MGFYQPLTVDTATIDRTVWPAVHKIGLLGARPAATSANQGWIYTATDDNGGQIYESTGSAWIPLAAPVNTTGLAPGAVGTTQMANGAITTAKLAPNAGGSSGLSGARPGAGTVPAGYEWTSTDINGGTSYVSDGTSWIPSGVGVADPRLTDTRTPSASSITSAMFTAGAVNTAALGALQVTGAKIAASTITVANLAASATGGVGLAASRPAATSVPIGYGWLSTDTNAGQEYVSDGTTWQPAGAPVNVNAVASNSVVTASITDGAVTAKKLEARIGRGGFLETRSRGWMQPDGTGAAVVGYGVLSAATLVGTGATLVPATSAPGHLLRAAATAASVAYMQSVLTGNYFGLFPSFRTVIRPIVTTSQRVWAGVQSSSSPFGTDTPTMNYQGFRASSNAGDTNVKAYTYNGAASLVVDTGVPWSSSYIYDLSMYGTDATGTLAWVVRRYDATTLAFVDETAGTIAATSTALGQGAVSSLAKPLVGIETLTAATRDLAIAAFDMSFGLQGP